MPAPDIIGDESTYLGNALEDVQPVGVDVGIKPSSGMLFKGFTPSTVNVKTTPTVFIYGMASPFDTIGSGMQVSLADVTPGSEVF